MPIEEIHILHHTHVDVGYTDLQPVIYRTHVQYLEQVLEYCRQTDDYPDEAKFRWISEFSWPMVEFMRQRPSLASEMAERLRQERVELAGLFLDPTDLMDRRAFEMSLKPALDLAGRYGFPLTTAMTSDIPGVGWGLCDVLIEQGLKYLSVSPNAMVSKPILVERPFWWVGHRGNRTLVWLTDWRKGWYGECHVLGFPQGFDVTRKNLLEYVDLLQLEGYKWDVLALHFAADNYPPSRDLPDLVRRWNDEVGTPRLRISSNKMFLDRLQELHGHDFPEYRMAWPDWWSEGLGSAAYESGLSRETHCRLQRIEALQHALGDTQDLWPIWEDLLVFDEHTFGSSNMATEPWSFRSRASWAHKSANIYRAYDAARRLEDELAGRLGEARPPEPADYRDQTVQPPQTGARRVVFHNPLATEFIGPVSLTGLSLEVTSLDGTLPVQHAAATRLRPATSWAVVGLAPGETKTCATTISSSWEGSPDADDCTLLRNEFYRLRFDGNGRLLSLFDLQDERELLDPSAPWGFAETIHETVQGYDGRRAVWERHMLHLPWGHRRTDAPFARVGALQEASLLQTENGPLYTSLTWRSELPDVRYLETEIRLWHGLRRLDVQVRLDKQAQTDYESLSVAFPFALTNPRGFVHNCDTVFEAEAEQLPGTVRDYYGVQHFAALQGDEGWAAMCPVQAPLVQLGQLNFGKWSDHLALPRGCLYSWLTNNFWYTNFPGYQLGELTFDFTLLAGSGELDSEYVTNSAEAARVAVTARTS